MRLNNSRLFNESAEPVRFDLPGSVSFGETRRFQMRHKQRKEIETVNINLVNGSYLLMKGSTRAALEAPAHEILGAYGSEDQPDVPRHSLKPEVIIV